MMRKADNYGILEGAIVFGLNHVKNITCNREAILLCAFFARIKIYHIRKKEQIEKSFNEQCERLYMGEI